MDVALLEVPLPLIIGTKCLLQINVKLSRNLSNYRVPVYHRYRDLLSLEKILRLNPRHRGEFAGATEIHSVSNRRIPEAH
jgi:hypothetical protein